MNKNNTVKTVFMMVIISIIGKALGLFRDMEMAYFFGTETIESKAFTTASVLPRVFLDITFASAITAGFIPIFNEILESKNKEKAFSLANNFLNIILIVSIVLITIGMIFPTQLTYLSQANLDYETRTMAAELLKIMLPIIIFAGIAFTFTGILQSFGEFNIPSAMSIVSNSIIILYFFTLVNDFSVYGLAVAYTLGWLLQIFIQIPTLKKNGYKYKFTINFKDEYIKKISKLILPVMVSTWAVPLNYLFNYNVASLIDGGTSAVALNVAYTFYNIVTGVFILSISNLILPKLSKLSVNNDMDTFGKSVNKTVKSLLFLIIPMSAGLMLLSEEIIVLFFQRGAFDEKSTYLAKTALTFYSLGIVGYGLQNVLVRAFYSLKDGKTPLVSSAIYIAINVFLTLMLYKVMAIGGIALSSSISITITGLILFYKLCKINSSIFSKSIVVDFFKNIISVLIMSVVVIFVKNYIGTILDESFFSKVTIVAVPVICGVATYFLSTLLLGVEESKDVLNIILKKQEV